MASDLKYVVDDLTALMFELLFAPAFCRMFVCVTICKFQDGCVADPIKMELNRLAVKYYATSACDFKTKKNCNDIQVLFLTFIKWWNCMEVS